MKLFPAQGDENRFFALESGVARVAVRRENESVFNIFSISSSCQPIKVLFA